ncbi:MAG: TonB-dependent receptor, partial [Pseudomonadota bacterium]|nr:TonB-dependent receptor [Pseudomonadota bacterium]
AGAATPGAAGAAGAASAAPQQLQRVDVVGVRQRLDSARNSLLPETGSTIYRFGREDLGNLPLGDSTPINQVLLQVPGVVQDSYGQLHVRGDHSNVQYRINGVVIPEAISGFGQSLETRFASDISFLTGALPAQYGYRTAGVVDIRTKGNSLDNGGSISVLGGSRGYLETNAEVAGSAGPFSYFFTGSSLHNNVGIENPTPDSSAVHDRTHQSKGFGYMSYLLDSDSRVSVILGTSNNRFQIPNNPGQEPNFMLAGRGNVDSANLDARQRERNRFAVVTYQASVGSGFDYQLSLFDRWTDLHYQPDQVGDLVFNGVAADITRRNSANGLQLDTSYRLSHDHTLRAGLFAQRESFTVGNRSTVFRAADDGTQTTDVPFTIQDDSRIAGHLWGVYLQDEWRPLKALTVNYGLRYDKVDTVVDESQISPRVGVVYDVTPDLRIHAGYSRYFTPPPTEKIDTTSVQKFIGTTNALPSDANTAVKSERSNYYDIGFAFQLTREITFGVDGYYRDVRHLQDEGQFGNALIFSAFNYERGKIGGLELTSSYRDKGLTAYANLGFTRARGKTVETGQFNFDAGELAYINSNDVHLDHEQRLTASAGIAYRLGTGLTLSSDALYGSGLRNGFANTEHLPSYTQINLAAEKTFDFGPGFGKISGRLAVLNVFDRSYELRDGSGIGVGAPQYGTRRTFIAGVTKYF